LATRRAVRLDHGVPDGGVESEARDKRKQSEWLDLLLILLIGSSLNN